MDSTSLVASVDDVLELRGGSTGRALVTVRLVVLDSVVSNRGCPVVFVMKVAGGTGVIALVTVFVLVGKTSTFPSVDVGTGSSLSGAPQSAATRSPS